MECLQYFGVFFHLRGMFYLRTLFLKNGLDLIQFTYMTITCENEENMQPVFRISNWGRLDGPFCCLLFEITGCFKAIYIYIYI